MAVSLFEHFTFLYEILTNLLVLYSEAMPAEPPLSCDCAAGRVAREICVGSVGCGERRQHLHASRWRAWAW